MSIITDPIIGASLLQVWKPDARATNTTGDGDKYAPFALGQRGLTNDLTKGLAQFVRVTTGNIPNANGTTPIGVTNGVTAAAATGNNWYNLSGLTPVAGDYMFLAAAGVTA
jgi:hypothetical protein